MPRARRKTASKKKAKRSSPPGKSSSDSKVAGSGHGGTIEEKLEAARGYVTMPFDYIGIEEMQEAANNPNQIRARR